MPPDLFCAPSTSPLIRCLTSYFISSRICVLIFNLIVDEVQRILPLSRRQGLKRIELIPHHQRSGRSENCPCHSYFNVELKKKEGAAKGRGPVESVVLPNGFCRNARRKTRPERPCNHTIKLTIIVIVSLPANSALRVSRQW